MNYFSKYKLCGIYFQAYGKNSKCREYIRYNVRKHKGLMLSFTLDSKLHNIRGYALKIYRYTFGLDFTGYYKNGKYHNSLGPAITYHRNDGTIVYVAYLLNAAYRDGYNQIEYCSNGRVFMDYYHNGKNLANTNR